MPRKKAEPKEVEPEVVETPQEEITEIENVKPPRYEVPIRLGFGKPPGRHFVFIGTTIVDGVTSCWYSMSADQVTRVPIFESSLIGYLHNIRITPKKYKDKWGYKVDLTIAADKEYVVRSGVETEFSRRLINALVKVEDFSRPICITTAPGNEEKVVFGHVSDGITGKGIFVYNEEIEDKLSPLIFSLQERLGVEVQSGASIKQEIKDFEERNLNK